MYEYLVDLHTSGFWVVSRSFRFRSVKRIKMTLSDHGNRGLRAVIGLNYNPIKVNPLMEYCVRTKSRIQACVPKKYRCLVCPPDFR